MVTSEARPFAKTGGLADVCGALPLALARLGHRVTIVLPNYRGTRPTARRAMPADVPFGLHSYPVRFLEQRWPTGVTAVLVDAPALYDRDGLYGDGDGDYGDNAFRFAVLCRGALEYARLARAPALGDSRARLAGGTRARSTRGRCSATIPSSAACAPC